jgi:hypothetical protein
MNISRCLLPSALLAGVVFCGSTLPLAVLGSQPVTIQLGGKPIFVGRFEEIAAPYLGFATAISLGAGVVNLATAGWRHSSRKLGLAEEQVSTLKQQLSEKATLIEDLKFSESRLSTSGLEMFLEGEENFRQQTMAVSNVAVHNHQPVSTSKGAETHYVVMGSVQPIDQPSQPQVAPGYETIAHQPLDLTVGQEAKDQAATALASAQASMGFARPSAPYEANVEPSQPSTDQSENVADMSELLSHLKQVMTQIERLNIEPFPAQERSAHSSSASWKQRQLVS